MGPHCIGSMSNITYEEDGPYGRLAGQTEREWLQSDHVAALEDWT